MFQCVYFIAFLAKRPVLSSGMPVLSLWKWTLWAVASCQLAKQQDYVFLISHIPDNTLDLLLLLSSSDNIKPTSYLEQYTYYAVQII